MSTPGTDAAQQFAAQGKQNPALNKIISAVKTTR